MSQNIIANNHQIKNTTRANLRYINDYFSHNWKHDSVLKKVPSYNSLNGDKKVLRYLHKQMKNKKPDVYARYAQAANFMYARFNNQYLYNVAVTHPHFKTTTRRLSNMMNFRSTNVNPKFSAVDLQVSPREEQDFMRNEHQAVDKVTGVQKNVNLEHKLTSDVIHNNKHAFNHNLRENTAQKFGIKVTKNGLYNNQGRKLTAREALARVRDVAHADDPTYNLNNKLFGMSESQQRSYSQKAKSKLRMNSSEVSAEANRDQTDVAKFQKNLANHSGVTFLQNHPNLGTALYLKTDGKHIYSKTDIGLHKNVPYLHNNLEKYVNNKAFAMNHHGASYKEFYKFANPDDSANKKWEHKATIQDYINQRAEVDGMESSEHTDKSELKDGLSNLQTLYPSAHEYMQTSAGKKLYSHELNRQEQHPANRLSARGFKAEGQLTDYLPNHKPRLWNKNQIHTYYNHQIRQSIMGNRPQDAIRLKQFQDKFDKAERHHNNLRVYANNVKDGSFSYDFKNTKYSNISQFNKYISHLHEPNNNMMSMFAQKQSANHKTSTKHNDTVVENRKYKQQRNTKVSDKPKKHISRNHGINLN